ncbi:MAG: SH3 domain-containing protein [Chlorobi bacterium]|nr:SH3 domain-containing protein [Chlorobiota bacterium]
MNLFFKKKDNKPIKNKLAFISATTFGLTAFIFIAYLLLGELISVIKKDFSSETMIVVSEKLNMRSDKDDNAYVIGTYPFGTKVEVYNVFDNNWAEVSVKDKKGYMSFEFLVLPENFYLIEGMFGNENAKSLIKAVKYRKAISNYLKNNKFTSKIPKSEREKLYGKDDNKEVWQIFAENKKSEFNTFCFGDYNGDKNQDAAFIITNIETGKRKLIILNIETKFSKKYGKLITSKDLNKDFLFIKHIPKRTKMIINDSIKRIPVDAILIGTNREHNFNDIPKLMIYNGKSFDIFPQNNKNEE